MPAFVLLLAAILPSGPLAPQQAQKVIREDTIATSAGPLVIGFVGHASLYFRYAGKVVQVDPVSREADYATLPKADLVLVTHDHGDHLDPAAIAAVRKDGTRVLVSRSCAGRVPGAEVLENGAAADVAGIRVQAVPAYNIVNVRAPGQPYHPKGAGNGYVLTFGDKHVYVAGDTENTPEMKALKDIDVAFLPMNLPYTMTPEMVADAAKTFRPRILYPYHFGQTEPQKLVALMKGESGIEVRVREMQ